MVSGVRFITAHPASSVTGGGSVVGGTVLAVVVSGGWVVPVVAGTAVVVGGRVVEGFPATEDPVEEPAPEDAAEEPVLEAAALDGLVGEEALWCPDVEGAESGDRAAAQPPISVTRVPATAKRRAPVDTPVAMTSSFA
jgi:hypothetical protein